MDRKIILIILLSGIFSVHAQHTGRTENPKLVVGIVVDQMRQEYLYRFYPKFGNGGFKRIITDGFELKNAHYNYVPTITGPGHASVYTGSTPAVHGIIGNDWYDKNLKKLVNCVDDPKQTVVGNSTGKGTVSPWRLLTTTITDELKLSNQKRSKIVGISVKDRGAVLPAGHLADGAYWYDGRSGDFVTSSFYAKVLTPWAEKFNQLKLADKYLSQTWNTLYPITQYTESLPDENSYESKLFGKENTSFPYDLKTLKTKSGYNTLLSTPFANDYIIDFTKAAIEGEKLGQDEWTDFLAISFSATDVLGHDMGPRAIEIEDMYLRLDKNVEDLLKTLDSKVGSGNYTIFITADHGVAENAQYLKDNRIPSGYFSASNVKAGMSDYLKRYFPNRDIIEYSDEDQVYLNQDAFQNEPKASGIDLLIGTELITNYLMQMEGVANVFSESILRQGRYDEGGIKGMVIRGYHPKRSGDITVILEPGWYSAGKVPGSTHGSPYSYDTNVPVLFYGKGIKKGSSVLYHPITDIAPTLSVLLKIKFPSGCMGNPIAELFE
jgi:predicted AlkP superfamily pyrophosphatase or phosphodiesterase